MGVEFPAEGRQRAVIERVTPEIDCGRFPVKRVVGERVSVSADVFADGHDRLKVVLLFRHARDSRWHELPMAPAENDRWEASFTVSELGRYRYTVLAWVDPFVTWQDDLRKRAAAGQDLAVALEIGAGFLEDASARAEGAEGEALRRLASELRGGGPAGAAVETALGAEASALMRAHSDRGRATRYPRELEVVVDPPLAGFGAWYEFFPRSLRPEGRGTLADCEAMLPELARLGFDVVYLPPIHPIGVTHRKGRGNSVQASPGDPGSPWAIGAAEGGHKAVHPQLGTVDDLRSLASAARRLGMEIALDLAFQCSPDHPYVREHPEWFRWRPDGTIQFAENPPKKYEDIVPFDFETPHWRALWDELLGVVRFWVGQGVRVFRVDNPHTKALGFWEWLIAAVKEESPQVLFLSEAFTRPKLMYRLAKLGFSQSYTYFTWRHTRAELTAYVEELTRSELREYFRPNFWPNTPDILPEVLQYGGRPAFVARLVLAATLSGNYGLYGPAFELCVDAAVPGREEYADSEKYEAKRWDPDEPRSLRPLIARVNALRRQNPALQTTWNTRFCESGNDSVLFYAKRSEDGENDLLVAVSLDPFQRQTAWLNVPLDELGLRPGQPYLVSDLLGDETFVWHAAVNRFDFDPQVLPARIFRVRTRLRREQDFDYFS